MDRMLLNLPIKYLSPFQALKYADTVGCCPHVPKEKQQLAKPDCCAIRPSDAMLAYLRRA